MKTRILARQAVITAGMKYADMEKVAKYAPETMALCDNDGNETFRVTLCEHNGSVTALGMAFAKDGDEAIATIIIPSDVEDKKAFVAENYGVAIMMANQVIDKMNEKLEGIDSIIADITASIENVD